MKRSAASVRIQRSSAFTMVELLVVLFVIGVLLSLLLPAVQQAREAARRTQCRSHMHQFGLALHNYHDAFQMFPPGNSRGLSFHVMILPFIDQQTLYESFRNRNPDPDFYDVYWINYLGGYRIPSYQCPSDPWGDVSHDGRDLNGNPIVAYSTSYLGNAGTGVQAYGYNGVFRNASPVRAAEITDGLSNTAMVSEVLIGHDRSKEIARTIWSTPYSLLGSNQLEQFAQLCRITAQTQSSAPSYSDRMNNWVIGQIGQTMYNHVLFPNDASCYNGSDVQEGAYSAASLHHGVVHVLAADGHVRGVSSHLDLLVWRALGSRNGGESFEFP
jgi:prepilin-type N-terminal cleavage/methylation domain-containing protein